MEFDKLGQTSDKRHIAVVGGGPAGMEAARVLALKGYDVTIFEQSHELGGQLNLANKPLRKEKINWLLDYLKHEMARLNVDVRLNTEACIEEIKALNPYAVLLATGAENPIPDIEGADLVHVHSYEDILRNNIKLSGSRIAVIGAGMTGCETAELLAGNGNDVRLVEMTPVIGSGIDATTRFDLLKHLKTANVDMMPDQKLCKITDTSIILENTETGEQSTYDTDHTIMAMGMTSYNPLEHELKEHFSNVFVLGDANRPGRISDAVKSGFETAFTIESTAIDSEKPIARV